MEAETPDEAQSRRYEAAESMLQHSRLPVNQHRNLNGLMFAQNVPSENASAQQINPVSTIPVAPYSDFRLPLQPGVVDPVRALNAPLGDARHSPPDIKLHIDQHPIDSYSRPLREAGTTASISKSAGSHGARIGQPDLASSARPQELGLLESGGSKLQVSKAGKKGRKKSSEDNGESEKPPPWSELKTKAGKERKRLPLACIACRRKKIRCSGEKPACKHCLRSRIPCVYKVTTRKAAPRTDYMAMLDKRLKRMEERVIKIIPGEENSSTSRIKRANVRPMGGGQGTKVHGGKKRAAQEAFGPDLEEWAQQKGRKHPLEGLEPEEKKALKEGADKLPSKELQEHLSEVFFESVYGQSYHLLHKPNFMRQLRAETAPPVLVLAVCAISARFSTHPQFDTKDKDERTFLRGEEWAAPARDIALKLYDKPNIIILTVLLILGLHEFGTCQGGRSWMFGGMAMRMAYALQLHREMDKDQLDRKSDKDPNFSAIDREIRRRTMWSCFLMDRFNSSGTERPTCGSEEHIKVQLPIKESFFQMGIPGLTECLDGDMPNPLPVDAGNKANIRQNMGVASHMVRGIALWGHVIRYFNLGGIEKDPYQMWQKNSGFAELKLRLEKLKTSLTPDLMDTPENLAQHAADKIANQFLLMHVIHHQIALFLHRYAIPTFTTARLSSDAPKDFVAEAAKIAIDSANRMSDLFAHGLNHKLNAPFAGYCAFTSSTIHIWGIFSKNPAFEVVAKENLDRNMTYLIRMKRYWGMFHFLTEYLQDIYCQHADVSQNGPNSNNTANAHATSLFQYGDWFQKYPHGVSKATDLKNPGLNLKEEPIEGAAPSQRSDVQSVEPLFNQLPESKRSQHQHQQRKPSRKSTKGAPNPPKPQPPQLIQQGPQHDAAMQPIVPFTPQTPIAPTLFSPPQNQALLQPYSDHPYDFLSQNPDASLLPQLDRHFVYDAYQGTSGPPISSADSGLSALASNDNSTPVFWDNMMGNTTAHPQTMGATGGYVGDVNNSQAWMLPFNLNPPHFPTDGGDQGFGRAIPYGNYIDGSDMDGMGGLGPGRNGGQQ
ncbi:MAG: hypothetical protein LQ342_001133 [Letrouitia transgressa]|nr:MAG: hypothetical protein LQ342_001133 [Letrouitia transgressa]